jgi:hypothetical protein
MPPILALYARFVCAQCMKQLPWATILTIRIRSHRTSRYRGLGPLRQDKLQGQTRHAAYRTRYDKGTSLQCQKTETTPLAVAHVPEHVAAVLEVPTPCLHSADHRQGHTIRQHHVTLYLLETIKEACRDHSKRLSTTQLNHHSNTTRDTRRLLS